MLLNLCFQVIILGVALLWGSNPIALRYLYASDGAHFGTDAI